MTPTQAFPKWQDQQGSTSITWPPLQDSALFQGFLLFTLKKVLRANESVCMRAQHLADQVCWTKASPFHW